MTLDEFRKKTKGMPGDTELYVYVKEEVEDALPGAVLDWLGGSASSVDVCREGERPYIVEIYRE